VPPPKATPINQVSIDSPCPACGHSAGRILCVRRDEQIFVERTCLVCGARTYQETILNKVDSSTLIHPAEDYFVTAHHDSLALLIAPSTLSTLSTLSTTTNSESTKGKN